MQIIQVHRAGARLQCDGGTERAEKSAPLQRQPEHRPAAGARLLWRACTCDAFPGAASALAPPAGEEVEVIKRAGTQLVRS